MLWLLIRWCRQEVANYKVLRRVAFVDSLPVNASGKVFKYELWKQTGELKENLCPERFKSVQDKRVPC
ncbi:MAG: AMP-binding enzyme [Endozoicomonas sp.]